MPLASARLARCSAKLLMPMKTPRLQVLDQLELGDRRIGVSRPDPHHADVDQPGRTRPNLAGGMDAERKRNMAQLARLDADARERTAPTTIRRSADRPWCAGRIPAAQSSRRSASTRRSCFAGRCTGPAGIRHGRIFAARLCRGSVCAPTSPCRRAAADRYGRACRDTTARSWPIRRRCAYARFGYARCRRAIWEMAAQNPQQPRSFPAQERYCKSAAGYSAAPFDLHARSKHPRGMVVHAG